MENEYLHLITDDSIVLTYKWQTSLATVYVKAQLETRRRRAGGRKSTLVAGSYKALKVT